MGILYIVSTPIGNLADISHRAVEVLGKADRVLAEDTRRTAILFRHYGIHTRLYSAHEHNEQARAEQVLTWLKRVKRGRWVFEPVQLRIWNRGAGSFTQSMKKDTRVKRTHERPTV